MIFYGGSEATVRKQLACDHEWSESSIDNVSRYRKCQKCFCIERDIDDEADYYERVNMTILAGV